ncbi:MAG: response regulator [Gammaproteobacteria bacterium SHHR-1]|uniref:response regulator n=1 Tax=Magnetovirga frankeli TaxID=947516 RepID=UPI001AF545C2|nr:response regulator [gamma proteobacterium SS-5]
MEKTYILYADDEPLNRVLMEDLFSDQEGFELGLADDGDSCLELAAQRAPALILLDVNMPRLDGYSACKALREVPATSQVPIIFVSALTSRDDRLAGYEAGGDDYITKPFDGEEVLRKVMLQVAEYQQRQQSQQALSKAEHYAQGLNHVVDFIRGSFGSQSLEDLCDTAFDCLGRFKLEGSILVNCFEEPMSFFSDGRERPLEQEVLLKLNAKGGILSFGQRYSLNVPQVVSLLVRNLPENLEDANLLSDHLALLLDVLAARLMEMREHKEAISSRLEASAIMQASQTTLENLHQQRNEQLSQSRAIMGNLEQDIENLFFTLGLTENQEEAIKRFIRDSSHRLEELFEEEEKIETQFQQVMSRLINSMTP